MSDDEVKALQKEVSQKKRIATEWASQIHDLVEDRLMTGYNDLPELARQTVAACEAWAAAKAKLDQVGA
ncbi:MAG: CCE_0567 family metalloprotein [Pseudomonadota bacterium]